jgi:putative NADPH-quinone reductase
MRISVILAHPNPESFNHAIAKMAVDAIKTNGHRVFFHDLYQEKFDPRLNLEELADDAILPVVTRKHCDELASADGIVIVHPNWWGQPPAILKGWVDRVIRPGVAYEFTEGDSGEGIPNGLSLIHPTQNQKGRRKLLAIRWKRSGKIASSDSAASTTFTAECSMSLSQAPKTSAEIG